MSAEPERFTVSRLPREVAPPTIPANRSQVIIPDHVLLRPVGHGAYGEVWLARSALGTLRAIKVVHLHDLGDVRPFERDFRGIQKYEPISRAHPGLIDILQVGRNDPESYFYYVMELADPCVDIAGTAPAPPPIPEPATGVQFPTNPSVPAADRSPVGKVSCVEEYTPRTLRKELTRRGRLPVEECVRLGLTLARAVEHLHAAGLVHRDIKPSNIICVGGQPKLADIGLVTNIGDAQSIVGTEGYLPPEGPRISKPLISTSSAPARRTRSSMPLRRSRGCAEVLHA